MQRFAPITAAVLAAVCCATPGHAVLLDGASGGYALPPTSFATAEDGMINPSLTFTGVPGYGTLTISYGPFFQGQVATDAFRPPISVSGTPAPLLSLTTSTDLQTVVETDQNNPVPNAEEIGGVPAPATNGFGGPVALLFSEPVTGVTLTAGYFDTVGTTTITAYTADGTVLGTVSNTGLGYETFNLADSTGRSLSGLLITTTDAGGFGIDGVGIATAKTLVAVPAPGSGAILPAMALVFAGAGGTWYRRRPTHRAAG